MDDLGKRYNILIVTRYGAIDMMTMDMFQYGDNVVERSPSSEWFNGPTHVGKTVLEAPEI